MLNTMQWQTLFYVILAASYQRSVFPLQKAEDTPHWIWEAAAYQMLLTVPLENENKSQENENQSQEGYGYQCFCSFAICFTFFK